MQNGIISWPPPYRLKKHRLARYVKMRPSKEYGLEITIPYRFNIKELPAILEEHKTWILKQLAQLPARNPALPDNLFLQAIDQHWPVFYEPCDRRLSLIERPQRELVLVGKQDNLACREKLITWVKDKAKEQLSTLLCDVSQQTGLTYKSLTFRDQRTLWGSCTIDHAISLNYKLIFLSNSLARHVMIHELCHTQYHNHSKRFWSLVAKFDPEWQNHRRSLRKSDLLLPDWL